MDEDISPEAMDAAIIGAAQKIEHYEIAGYGTARAWASELKFADIVAELQKTLEEEYQANDSLTKLAVAQINVSAENAVDSGDNYQDAADDDFERLRNSVSIMSSSDDRDF